MLNQSIYSKQEMRSTETEEFANVDISAISVNDSFYILVVSFVISKYILRKKESGMHL